MKVVVTGSTGLIGSALVESVRTDGHDVLRLVRRAPAAPDEAQWDPVAHTVDDAAIDGADVVVNLAGAGIGDRRWTPAYKALVRDSRVDGTTTIANAVVRHKVPLLVQASAVGWYGDRGDDVLRETEPGGDGFLCDLVRDWEAAAKPAEDVGVRVVYLRTGIVLSPNGGALKQMLPIFKLGLGGRLGSGRQWFPWISLTDEIAAIRFVIEGTSVAGPFNLAAPVPVTNRELTKALGKALHRPTVAAVPRLALRIGLLASLRVEPWKLLETGFEFADAGLDAALRRMV
jgi:uncharacterized protein (TIGR01777 family)